jgi:predicted secreted protein
MLKFKTLSILFIVFQILAYNAIAKDSKTKPLSIVTTSTTISKTVKCNKALAKFELYAEGDNYSMALERLKKINNNFLKFIKERFTQKEIQTSSIQGYSKNASIYVTVDTGKIGKIQDIFQYILNTKFEYKTGIKPINLNLYISNELQRKIENMLFKNALETAKAKLKTTNEILGGYFIKNIYTRFNSTNPIEYDRNNGLMRTYYQKSQRKSNINIASGSKTIKININLSLAKKMDE